MATKRRGNEFGLFAITWLMLTVTFTCVWYIFNGVVWVVFAVLAALISAGFGYAQYRREGRLTQEAPRVAPEPQAGPPKTYRTRAQIQRQRRAEVARGMVRTGWTRMGTGLGDRGCSVRCRDSRLPARFCRCRGCGGKAHGSHRRISTEVTARLAAQRSAPKPAARRAKRPTGKPTATRKPATARRAPREVQIPAGQPSDPVVVTWYADDGQQVQAKTSIATARILKERGRLIEARVSR